MMDTKFTPGPWSLSQENTPADDYGYWYHRITAGHGYSGNGFDICGIINPHDAHLMAAAPELYEALEAAANSAGFQYMWPATRSKVEEALAKARGEA
ncbi:hypothetical protein JQC79_10440 [Ochrobactrum anthropi]|uniref:hypothetical protein n=1 Tax=Brucella anthropi TaxID=529 RepID=UPI00194F696C|nr:hypothetical protein [Brucella anthropi]MBM6396167.1 hypothetical protein [Brucella anthropi]